MSCTLCANTRCLRCFCAASFVRTCAAFARFVRIRAAFDALCLHHRGISTLCANTCCLCVLFAQLSSTRHKVYFDRTMWRSLPRSCQQERGATTSSQHELQLSCHTVPEGLVVEASTGVKLVHRLQNVPRTLHAQCVCTLVFTPRTVCLHPRVHAHALLKCIYMAVQHSQDADMWRTCRSGARAMAILGHRCWSSSQKLSAKLGLT